MALPNKSYHPSGQIVKYRPAFTLEQITHLASILQTDNEDPISISIVRILVPLISKIENKIIEPAYVIEPAKITNIIVSRPIEDSDQYRYYNDLMSKEEQDAYETKLLGLE